MTTPSPIAILGDNWEWAEISTEEADRLLASGTLYLCGGDGRPDIACHVDDVYHVSPALSDEEQSDLIRRLRLQNSDGV